MFYVGLQCVEAEYKYMCNIFCSRLPNFNYPHHMWILSVLFMI